MFLKLAHIYRCTYFSLNYCSLQSSSHIYQHKEISLISQVYIYAHNARRKFNVGVYNMYTLMALRGLMEDLASSVVAGLLAIE